MTARKKDLVVRVRRELMDGQVYSEIRDLAPERQDVTRSEGQQISVVIDRAKRRPLDTDSVLHRAQYIADLLGVPYDEDLSWPCKAARGYPDCQCPDCAKKNGAR